MRGGLGLLLVLVGLWPAAAHAQGIVGGLASDNLEHVAVFSLDGRANGGKLLGKTLYVTTGATLEILDVSEPEAPRELGSLNFELIDGGYLATGYQEDVDTNGRVLIRSDGGQMQVVDVSDPASPAVLSTLDGVDNHTMSCLLDCTWVYGSEGAIVDLRDPAKPRESGALWLDVTEGVQSEHDVTEVAPGIVLTATQPMYVLDAREDPEAPKVLAAIEAPGFVHGTAWPGRGEGEIALAGGEAMGPSPACQDDPSSTFHTWDTRGWRETRTFRLLDEYRLTPTEQEGATLSVWCTHWFDQHPQFVRGGLVAIAWYEQGVRLLSVAGDGRIEQTGYFLPHGGSVWDVRWIDDRTIYSFDHHRGIDILRYTGELPDPAEPLPGPPPAAPSPGGDRPVPEQPETPSQPTSGPKLSALVTLPRSCRGRTATLRVKPAARSVEVRLGRRVVGRARRAGRLRIRRLPRRAFTLRVVATGRDGARVTGSRRLRCR